MPVKVTNEVHTLFTHSAYVECAGVKLHYRSDNFVRRASFTVVGYGCGCVYINWDHDQRQYLEYHKLKTLRGKLHYMLEQNKDSLHSPEFEKIYEALEKESAQW